VELLADDRVADLVTEGIDVALRTTVGHSDLVVARALGHSSGACTRPLDIWNSTARPPSLATCSNTTP
jgi:DNA-binding transcriptional LysR family regulator